MSKTICRPFIAVLLLAVAPIHGAESPASFLGAQSCSSTGCHGGGGVKQNQFLTWSLKDFHSQRPAATLTTARSRQIAGALAITDPTVDTRCTTCHAPLRDVPENRRGEGFKVSEGVSCESCHGPAEHWLRAHTRTDYTGADRTAAGMRDLQDLYVRANTCVACHQVVAVPLLKAGHPELIFELDGQSVAEPRHWSAEKNGSGAQAWLVGQAVVLRELSWQMTREHPMMTGLSQRMTETNLLYRIYAASWVLRKATDAPLSPATMAEDFEGLLRNADELAREKSKVTWTSVMTRDCLLRLAGSREDFLKDTVPVLLQARRAERLVLALDRLLAAENNHTADAELNQLFKLAQSLPDFEPKPFADALEQFSLAVQKR